MYMTEWPTQSYSLIEQQLSTPAVCLLALAGAPDLEEVVLLLGEDAQIAVSYVIPQYNLRETGAVLTK